LQHSSEQYLVLNIPVQTTWTFHKTKQIKQNLKAKNFEGLDESASHAKNVLEELRVLQGESDGLGIAVFQS